MWNKIHYLANLSLILQKMRCPLFWSFNRKRKICNLLIAQLLIQLWKDSEFLKFSWIWKKSKLRSLCQKFRVKLWKYLENVAIWSRQNLLKKSLGSLQGLLLRSLKWAETLAQWTKIKKIRVQDQAFKLRIFKKLNWNHLNLVCNN